MKKLSQFDPRDLVRNTTVYNDYYNIRQIDGWSREDKDFNFSYMRKIESLSGHPLKGSSVLDVGCGTGDMAPFLRHYGIRSYMGIDIYEPALILARKKYPQERFLNADILAGEIFGEFDFIFCSGALSVKLEATDNYDFLSSMIETMWDLTRYGLVFNLMVDTDPDPDPDLFYYSLSRVKVLCNTLAPDTKLLIEKTPLIDKYDFNDQSHIFMFR